MKNWCSAGPRTSPLEFSGNTFGYELHASSAMPESQIGRFRFLSGVSPGVEELLKATIDTLLPPRPSGQPSLSG